MLVFFFRWLYELHEGISLCILRLVAVVLAEVVYVVHSRDFLGNPSTCFLYDKIFFRVLEC